MIERSVTMREAAEILGVSYQTLRRWRSEGYGPQGHKYGRTASSPVRFLPSVLAAWREAHLEDWRAAS